MKIGDLVEIHTYRNSGDIEAIGILLKYNLVPPRTATVHVVDGTQQVVPVGLISRCRNENR